MNVQVTDEMIKAMGAKHLKDFGLGLNDEALRWNGTSAINLRRCSPEQVTRLHKLLEGPNKENVKGARKAMRDLKVWIEAGQRGAENVKCKDTKQFAALVRTYMEKQPGHRLYGKDEEHGVWRAYYVGNIEFHPKQSSRGVGVTPAYTSMHLFYSELGVNHLVRVTVNDKEYENRTVPEVLLNEGYLPESEELREDYATNLKKYDAIYNKLGMQFWASGIGTTNLDGNNDDEENRGWRYWKMETVQMVRQGERARVVIDVAHETEKRSEKGDEPDPDFWSNEPPIGEDEEEDAETEAQPSQSGEEGEEQAPVSEVDIPVHTVVPVFDLKRHMRLRVHVTSLEEYVYDEKLGEKLVLPPEVRQLVEILLQRRGDFRDIVSGKGGGVTVMCAGIPGVGKTLTAEVFAEVDKRALYSVQCSQLGTDPDELEAAILKAFARAQRWNAILLLDESDVYVRARGTDIQQNAIVGVFLRVLEYYSGVLFLTTNRADEVDDAILSRCMARIDYGLPTVEEQARIWNILAETSGTKLAPGLVSTISTKYPNLSGRDVKQLLKLSSMVAASKGQEEVTVEVVESVKRFKPSTGDARGHLPRQRVKVDGSAST